MRERVFSPSRVRLVLNGLLGVPLSAAIGALYIYLTDANEWSTGLPLVVGTVIGTMFVVTVSPLPGTTRVTSVAIEQETPQLRRRRVLELAFIDVERSARRSLTDRLLGIQRLYSQSGRKQTIARRLFTPTVYTEMMRTAGLEQLCSDDAPN